MTGKCRVLFLVSSLSRAGAQTQLVDLANGLSNEHYEKHLFTVEDKLEQLERVDRDNIRFYNQRRRYKYDVIAVAKSISRIIDENQIDVVHCTLQFSLMLGWLARLSTKRPTALIAAIHTTQNRSVKEELMDRYLYRWLLYRCDRVIFVCDKQRDVWVKKFPRLNRNAVVVHNGVDTDYFTHSYTVESCSVLRNLLGIPSDALVVCCVARFRPEKAHDILLRSFAKVSGSPHLILAGDGELEEDLRSLAHNLGIENRVYFLGSIGDVRPVLSASNLSVLASTAVETFSITMLESMSMEVPVLATDIGGMSEAVLPGLTGALVPAGDEPALANMLDSLLSRPADLKSLGCEARTLVMRRFTRAQMICNTDTVISKLGKMISC